MLIRQGSIVCAGEKWVKIVEFWVQQINSFHKFSVQRITRYQKDKSNKTKYINKVNKQHLPVLISSFEHVAFSHLRMTLEPGWSKFRQHRPLPDEIQVNKSAMLAGINVT